MKYKPFPLSDLKKLHLVDPGAFLHSFRRTSVFLIFVMCTLMPASNAIAQGSWSTQTSGTIKNLNSVYCVSATTCWAVGQDGTILQTIDGGTTWNAQTSGTSSTLNSVYFVNANTGWAVGDGSSVLNTQNGGGTWSVQTVTTTTNLHGVVFANATTGWAVGDAGTILGTTDGTSWSVQTVTTTANLRGVNFNSNSNRVVTAGDSGTILLSTNGTSWSVQTVTTTTNLNSVDKSLQLVVGDGGTILYYDFISTNWVLQNSGTANNLNSIDANNFFWVVGDNGTIIASTQPNIWSPNWMVQPTVVTSTLNSIAAKVNCCGPVMFAVGDNGTILKYQLASAPAAPTNLVATPCGSQVEISFTAGANGGSPITNYQYSLDGTNWTTLSPAVTASPVTITSLTSGTYNISLRAVNSVGTGVSSTTVTATIDTNAAITVTYTGTTLATTTNKSANITLSATVTLPVGSNASQQAQLRFIDRGTGQDLSGWLSLTGTSNTGTVSHTAALTLGTYEIFRKYNIGIELGGAGCYTRNSPADNVTVTVAEPSCGCY